MGFAIRGIDAYDLALGQSIDDPTLIPVEGKEPQHHWRFFNDARLPADLEESCTRRGSTNLAAMTGAFEAWADKRSNLRMLEACAKELVRIRRTRATDKARWERFALGAPGYTRKNFDQGKAGAFISHGNTGVIEKGTFPSKGPSVDRGDVQSASHSFLESFHGLPEVADLVSALEYNTRTQCLELPDSCRSVVHVAPSEVPCALWGIGYDPNRLILSKADSVRTVKHVLGVSRKFFPDSVGRPRLSSSGVFYAQEDFQGQLYSRNIAGSNGDA